VPFTSSDVPVPFDLVYIVEGEHVKYAGHNLHGGGWKRKARAGELSHNPPSHPKMPVP
jgi:hypothetical protein